ncbi:MAG: hypothetical protein ABIH23_21625 [bacterium]
MELLEAVSGWVSGTPLVVFLVGTGLFLTIRLRFIQLTALGRAFFKALMTALAATIGTRNMAGVVLPGRLNETLQ